MSPHPPTDIMTLRYKRHRFPAEIIAHAAWLDFRFPLSLRHVEDILAERGIEVSFQTVAEWAAKFGRGYARSIRRRSRGSFADKWHLDEMVVAIKGVNGCEKARTNGAEDCGGESGPMGPLCIFYQEGSRGWGFCPVCSSLEGC